MMARIAAMAVMAFLLSVGIIGCATVSVEGSREMRLEGINAALYGEHDRVLARYEEQELRYLEMELQGKVDGELQRGLSQMRGMYLEMQEHLGRVLESHHRTVSNHSEVRHGGKEEGLDQVRDDYLHFHEVAVLQAHHERFVDFHRKMIFLSAVQGEEELVRGHRELMEMHRGLRRRCGEKMELLQKEYGVEAEHQELIEPFELAPEEEPPEGPELI